MVVTGHRGRSSQDFSQVVDVNSNKSCTDLPPYPVKMSSATGGVLKGSPLICGGYHKDETINPSEIHSSCYMHEKSSNTWILHANMNTKRYDHSCACHDNVLWLTGGVNEEKLPMHRRGILRQIP